MVGNGVADAAWRALYEPMLGVAEWWRWWHFAGDCVAATAGEPELVARRQRRRLGELIAHARARSPFYRDLYADLPPGADSPGQLPVVGKRALMADFDRWVTDPGVRRADVQRFIADPARIGEAWLGRYAVWTSSGSTGEPGIFVQDPDALAVYDALLGTRCAGARASDSPWRVLAGGGRMAMVAALDGHFAGVASWERVRRTYPLLRAQTHLVSVLQPLARIVDDLNHFDPALVASYPTTMTLLAHARRRGRLRIRPRSIWCGGETMTRGERDDIADAFGCPVYDDYGASEFMAIAFDCGHGALHVNADWVILEPVDAEGLACPPGEASATVLLTNLANKVQPLIRYDLGDSVTVRATRCPCGSRLPAITVDGRRDDILCLARDDGEIVRLLPLAVETVVEQAAGMARFQVVGVNARAISVRFETPPGVARDALWQRIRRALGTFLLHQGLAGVAIGRDERAPITDPRSGKFRQVIAGDR